MKFQSDHSADIKNAFHKTGDVDDPESNVVDVGADRGKFLSANVFHDNLVTEGVITCIAVIAHNDASGQTGLWHLHKDESTLFGKRAQTPIKLEMLPALTARFDPVGTELYLIGGKLNGSEAFHRYLNRHLVSAGFQVTDTALYGPYTLDVAATSAGGIYAVKTGTDDCIISKQPCAQKLEHHSRTSGGRGRIWLPEWGRPVQSSKEGPAF